jgi:hypothetical protein
MSADAPKIRRRQEIWEEEYRANPYLARKPEAHLIERFRYLIESQSTLTENGQLGSAGSPRSTSSDAFSRLCAVRDTSETCRQFTRSFLPPEGTRSGLHALLKNRPLPGNHLRRATLRKKSISAPSSGSRARAMATKSRAPTSCTRITRRWRSPNGTVAQPRSRSASARWSQQGGQLWVSSSRC